MLYERSPKSLLLFDEFEVPRCDHSLDGISCKV